MAEKVAVKMDQCIPLPADVDDITAAAIAIPARSSRLLNPQRNWRWRSRGTSEAKALMSSSTVFGESTEILIRAAAKSGKDVAPIRFVQIGSLAGGKLFYRVLSCVHPHSS